MNSSLNRWLVSATWLAALFAVISASTKGAMGVGAMWSLPAAIGVTVAAMGWPTKPEIRIVSGLGFVWQLALIGAYWPFEAAPDDPSNLAGPMHWPMHSIVILVVLVLLAMSFVAIFLLPALGLTSKIRQACGLLKSNPQEGLNQVNELFEKDPALFGLWQEYLGQVRDTAPGQPDGEAVSRRSARDIFDPMMVAHTRLRLEFFRNLPGVFTGIGIIGTFSGLIMGLRTFKISQDPTVVQQSLERLLTGVWGAFLISAVAIALAIVVTVIEKIVMSMLSHWLDELVAQIDVIYPPRPTPSSQPDGWMPQLIEALGNFSSRAATLRGTQAIEPAASSATGQAMVPGAAAMVPMSSEPQMLGGQPLSGNELGAPLGAYSNTALGSEMVDMAQSTRAATVALSDMASRLPDLLSKSLQGATQNHQQATQAMKTLSARLENVASGIEFSARKTLESVAARLMQSEMNMVSRHHAVADHLGELVQRIEALCGLLQQDRSDPFQRNAMGGALPFGDPSGYGGEERQQTTFYSPPFAGEDDLRSQQFAGARASYGPQGEHGMSHGSNGYAAPPDDDPWAEPAPSKGFGA
jgi:MotA/TolQ/ExbB proton channel family